MLPAAVLLATAACTQEPDAEPVPLTGPSPAASSTKEGVTLLLEPRSDGRCCLVTSVNPGDSSTIVLCFVEVFNEAERLLSTNLVPPIPPGHRRSSGFEAPPGRQGHGFQEIPLDLSQQHYASTCRPAAWHGGAPI